MRRGGNAPAAKTQRGTNEPKAFLALYDAEPATKIDAEENSGPEFGRIQRRPRNPPGCDGPTAIKGLRDGERPHLDVADHRRSPTEGFG